MTEIKYCKISWKSEMLAKFELPDLEYPVPAKSFEMIASTGDVEFEDMLYWLQDYSSKHPKEWLECEPAIIRLSELIAPHEKDPDNLVVEGDNWSLLFGHVDLTREIVTIQRAGHLIAAIQNAGNGRLLVSAYRPLDSKAASYLTSLSLNPAQDGTVCMRPNNWEYALDCSAGTGNMYAAEGGESYLSYWEFGLGLCRDGSKVEEWYFQRGIEPIVAKFTVMQVGICYEKTEQLESNLESQSSLTESAINLIRDFYKVAELSGVELPTNALNYEVLPAPHLPPSSIPLGAMAVYVFSWNGHCLKVGKVGAKSHARYTSQHYNSKSSNSNLSKSLLKTCENLNIDITEETVGAWIKNNVDRINYHLDEKCGIRTLSLFEAFLQCRLKPKFEGFDSQK